MATYDAGLAVPPRAEHVGHERSRATARGGSKYLKDRDKRQEKGGQKKLEIKIAGRVRWRKVAVGRACVREIGGGDGYGSRSVELRCPMAPSMPFACFLS
ncbi:hypothetical protein VTK73DRAFT_4269 [Phialemonium thermophilum]|uniref:Uncharacterized protein n=1 Tax=Phialemonium thermophilum TaxID=223376 RepID=A0ABR3VAC9_9PEZI